MYVSRRHMDVHFKAVARDTIALLPSKRPLTLLDWGCGEALAAEDFVAAGVTLELYDPVPRAQNYLRSHISDARMHILTDDEAYALDENTIDVIFINSVLQYLSRSEFEKLLPHFHRILKKDGIFIVADIVPPNVSIISDVYHLLTAGIRNGFFIDACIGIIKTFFSPYRSIRKEQGFTMYTEKDIKELFIQYGFEPERKPNAGLSPQRMLIYATRT